MGKLFKPYFTELEKIDDEVIFEKEDGKELKIHPENSR